MNEEKDAYSLYEAGTRELLNQIGQGHPLYPNALDYQQRLHENIEQLQSQGDNDALRVERCRIMNELNKLAVRELGISFREICEQIEDTKGQEAGRQSSHVIEDPVSLVELGSGGPVCSILKNVEKARAYYNWDMVLRLCDHARKCATSHSDQAGLATARLYIADALAHSGRLNEGIDAARRARKHFRLQRDHRNMILADLLLAQIRLKTRQDPQDAYLIYRATRDLCQELESRARENMQSHEAQFYRQAIEGIQQALQALEDIDRVIAEKSCQSRFPDAIPVLQLSDGPDVVLQPARVINHLAVDKFTDGGHIYFLHPLDDSTDTLKFKAGATYFALPVPEDGWPSPISRKEQDFALVQAQASWKGPGVRWTGQEWVTGQFERDTTTGRIAFVMPKLHVIGEEVTEEVVEIEEVTLEYGCAVGLLKLAGSAEFPLGF
jgi:tetratricopeptide (TPR) repeat protein